MSTQDFKSNSDFDVNEGEVQADTQHYHDSHDAAMDLLVEGPQMTATEVMQRIKDLRLERRLTNNRT